MILTFSNERFLSRIKDRTKKHTIRKDANNRWRIGNKIEFWLHNPRNAHLHPFEFAKGMVVNIESIAILPSRNKVIVENCIIRSKWELDSLARNDGFEDWEEMKTWFTEDFTGKVIIWSQKNLWFHTQNKRGKFYPKNNQPNLFDNEK